MSDEEESISLVRRVINAVASIEAPDGYDLRICVEPAYPQLDYIAVIANAHHREIDKRRSAGGLLKKAILIPFDQITEESIESGLKDLQAMEWEKIGNRA